jgi:DNA-directed RNA polymerase subunit RPC12/RpoP
MNSVIERQSYRGVSCLHCSHPIPISPLVASIETETQGDASSPRKCQVFHLRCVSCGKEKPYKIGEIVEFEGTPVTRKPLTDPSSPYFNSMANKARVANA